MTAFSFQMRESTASRLEKLAERRKLSSVQIAELAIEEFVEREEWQIAEIEAAVLEASRGDFASEDEVTATFHKHANFNSQK